MTVLGLPLVKAVANPVMKMDIVGATVAKQTQKENLIMPIRIQRKRTKGWRMPANTVYVGRPTFYGNCFHGSTAADRDLAVKAYSKLMSKHSDTRDQIVKDLRGKNLACLCALEQPCHADVLLELANANSP